MQRGKRVAGASVEGEEMSTRSTRRNVESVDEDVKFIVEETHPWLQWPGADRARKDELNKALAVLEQRDFSQPRVMDWNVCRNLGFGEELEGLFVTRMEREEEGLVLEIPIWKRAFSVKENVYREWCLEFFSSLKVKREFSEDTMHSDKLIRFRLGGDEYEITLLQFGFFLGLYSSAEVANVGLLSRYVQDGERFSKTFDFNRAWFDLSGQEEHSTCSKIKIKDVKIPILRVIHKLLSYSFCHRASQQDKVYEEDLWMLHTFYQRDPTQYVNLVWVLACYLEDRAGGRQKSSKICCGHFVTRLATSLGLATQANIRRCSPPLKWRYLTRQDLVASGLIHPLENRLIDAETGPSEDQPPPQQPPPQQTRSEMLVDISGQLHRLNFTLEQVSRQVSGLVDNAAYHTARYQPTWEDMARARHEASHTRDPWAPYAPPPYYYPQQYQPPNFEQEGDDEMDDE